MFWEAPERRIESIPYSGRLGNPGEIGGVSTGSYCTKIKCTPNPAMGFLSAHTSLVWRGAMVTRYWRSFDHLIAYAQSRAAAHLPAWKAFNQSIGSDGTVGIWHETYQVAAGSYEAIYANMPRHGLSVAGTHDAATGHRSDARGRMAVAVAAVAERE